MKNSIKETDFDRIIFFNFNDEKEKEEYENRIKIIINNICMFLSTNNIPFNYVKLSERIKTLKIIRRDYQNPMYYKDYNVIYVTKYTKSKELLDSNREILCFIHEIIHFITSNNDEIDDFYESFDEFFTEYMTYIIAMRLSMDLSWFYETNVGGYLDRNDGKFMDLLCEKVGFKNIVTAFFTGNFTLLKELVGLDILNSIDNYYKYFIELYTCFNQPLSTFLEMLKKDILLPQRQQLDFYITIINDKINNISKKVI